MGLLATIISTQANGDSPPPAVPLPTLATPLQAMEVPLLTMEVPGSWQQKPDVYDVSQESRPLAPTSASSPRMRMRQAFLGGSDKRNLVFRVDCQILRRLVLTLDDIQDAQVQLSLADIQGTLSPEQIHLPDVPEAKIAVVGGKLRIHQLAAFLKRALATGDDTAELVIAGTSDRTILMLGPDSNQVSRRPCFQVKLTDHKNHLLFETPVKMQPGVYTKMRDGNFYYGDQRLRLWGTLGSGDVGRVRRMGFNAWRLWPAGGEFYDETSIRTGDLKESVDTGYRSLDALDRQLAELKENNLFIMATQLMGVMKPDLLTRDDSFVAGGEDWEQWKAAVKSMPRGPAYAGDAHFRRLGFFDQRVRRARFRHASNFLKRVNPYTGKRYAEDEAIAIWELDNELDFIKVFMEKAGSDLPPYFQNKLKAKWNRWLKQRYGDQQSLLKAWGSLKPGETIGSVACAPTSSQRRQYPVERASDFVRFGIWMVDSFYQDLRDMCRAQAPEGVGVAVAPFSFDTQYRPHIPWLYSQSRSDVANFGMYYWGTETTLDRPPSFYVMDSCTVEGKATVIYESNQARPNPYRAEFPYRLAALASWQDWDAVFMHYWGGRDRETDEEFMTSPMKYMTQDHYWNAVHHDADPVMTSAWAVAGQMFLSEAIEPAPKPAVYRVGAKGIFGYEFETGINMRMDTIRHGAVIRFEPDAEFSLQRVAEGPAQRKPERENQRKPERENQRKPEGDNQRKPEGDAGGIRAGNIFWDWPNEKLVIDSPTAKAYVGMAPKEGFTFADGTTLSGISTPWLAFGMATQARSPSDTVGQADDVTICISAVADAQNRGFDFDWKENRGPIEMARGIRDPGTAPVQVDRVDYTLSFPKQMQYQASVYDFALRRTAESRQHSSVIRLRTDAADTMDVTSQTAAASGRDDSNRNHSFNKNGVLRPIGGHAAWMTVVEVNSIGDDATSVVDPSPGHALHKKFNATFSVGQDESTDPSLANVWNPLPGVSWGDNFAQTLKALRGG
ncbi:MAG: beta-galactosidase, partial [Planctomycetota bacterium]